MVYSRLSQKVYRRITGYHKWYIAEYQVIIWVYMNPRVLESVGEGGGNASLYPITVVVQKLT